MSVLQCATCVEVLFWHVLSQLGREIEWVLGERMISGWNCKFDVVLRVSCVRLGSYTHMVTDTRTHVYAYIYV